MQAVFSRKCLSNFANKAKKIKSGVHTVHYIEKGLHIVQHLLKYFVNTRSWLADILLQEDPLVRQFRFCRKIINYIHAQAPGKH